MDGFLPDNVGSETAVLILGLTLIGALVCYLKTNLSPGGLIVPGVLVLTALEGLACLAATGICTGVCYGIVRLLMAWTILYGKRLFVVSLAVSVILELTLFMGVHAAAPSIIPQESVGFLVPGLMSYQFFKQGVVPTVVAVSIVTAAGCAVAMAVLAF